MLSGRQKHLVSMVHWNAAHCALAVEAYFKNNMVITRRFFCRHFNIHPSASVPLKNTIKL
jgi:hypothetical protein